MSEKRNFESLRIILLPFAALYGLGVVIRNWMFDSGILRIRSVGVPVISVGNLTAGGTGKTPIVEYIVNELLGAQYKVAVVSRGYKRKSKGTVVVSDGRAVLVGPEEGGDEPLQVARKFPSLVVMVDENRVRGARVAVERYRAQVIVLDDGFQHRYIHRDLDILVIDAGRSPQAAWLLPAGIHREPLSAAKRAHAIMISHGTPDRDAGVGEKFNRFSRKPQFGVQFLPKKLKRLTDGSSIRLHDVRNMSCFAFCGIARPEVFERTVREMGVQLKGFRAFPDHHEFTKRDMQTLLRDSAKLHPDLWMTTEKDAVRLMGHAFKQMINDVLIYYVEMETVLNDKDTFSNILRETISHYERAHSHYR